MALADDQDDLIIDLADSNSVKSATSSEPQRNVFLDLWGSVEGVEEKISLFFFEAIIENLLVVVSTQIEVWIESNSAESILPESTVAFTIVKAIGMSDLSSLLVPCLFRTLLVQAGVKAKRYSQQLLRWYVFSLNLQQQ